MAKLRTYVYVRDVKGLIHAFGPDDDVPEWAQKTITNPMAWAEAPDVSRLTVPAPEPARKTPAKRAAPRRRAADDGSAE